jgi:hypothetical protein
MLLLAVNIVFSGFDGASLEKVETVSETHFRCHVRGDTDQDGRNRQANWYYFRIDGARGRALTIDLVSLPGEYNYRPNRGAVRAETPPLWSSDDRDWRHFESVEYDAEEPRLRLRLKPTSDRVWIAHVPPYTDRHLQRLLEAVRRSGLGQVESIGKTVGGREIPLVTIGKGERVVWLMFRQHAWETGSSWAGDGAIRFLISDAAAARAIRDQLMFKIYPMCDPDGVANGKVRFNQHGFDLNRNWDVSDSGRMPEITAQRKAILDWVNSGRRLDLFLSLHNTETSEYLEGPPDSGKYKALGERFFSALGKNTTFAPTRPFFHAGETTTAGRPGRMTVSQGLYRDRKLPAFLMELRISSHPRLGHPPTIQDRVDFGAGLVRAAAEAIR